MKKFLFILFLIIITNNIAMENKPSHHQSNGTFKNPDGSPERTGKVKWSWSTFNKEKKKLDMTVPKSHVLNKNEVLKNLKNGLNLFLKNFSMLELYVLNFL